MRVESLLPAPVKMSSVQEQMQQHFSSYKSSALLDEMRIIGESQVVPGSRKVLNSELWHACAGPLVTLPQPGTLVYYFPQGHSEQVTASTRKPANSHIPNYPNLPSQLLCKVNDVTQHADKETDEIYAQITLQPVNSEVDAFPVQDLGHTKCKQPSEFFCKNLTASDTSTHGGFSVPRRAAEKLFPQLDYSMQPPNQELIVRDLHDNLWTFRHIYRGQPRRHLLTSGWSLFVGTKRLKAGDSVLFIRDEKSRLLLGVRRTNRQPTALPSSVLSADSMHIGVLAAAAHAAASRSPFTVYFNPRACPSEFIIPLAKYHKALYTQVSIGMRFGMMFETEESTKRRYMGTIVGISEFDPLRWSHSKWRNLQVEWDENGYGERPDRVSLWEIDTPESLFVFPSPSFKRQCLPGFVVSGGDTGFRNTKYLSQAPETGIGDGNPMAARLGSEQLLKMLLTPQIPYPNNQLGCNQSIYATILQNISGNNSSTTFASTSPPFGAMRSSLHQDVVTKPILSLQNTSLQSQELVKPQEQIILDNCQDQSKEPKSENLGSKCESSVLGETVTEKFDTTPGATMSRMELSDEDNEKSLVNTPQNENHVAPINEDQLLQTKRPENSSRQERSNLLETNGLNISAANQNYHPSQYIGNEEWMLRPLCYQPFTSPLQTPGSLCSSGIQDSIFLPASDYGTSSPMNISSIVNSETFNPFEAFQFPCISDPHTPQFLPSYVQEVLSTPELNLANEEVVGSGILPSEVKQLAVDEEIGLYKASNPCGVKDLSDENNYQSETYCNIQFEVNNRNILTSSCVSSTVVDGFGIERESSFHVPSEDLFSNFASNQDIQSQVTSTSLTDSQLLSLQDIPDASSGSMDINDCSFLNRCSMRRVGKQHLRTYTKVQKLGSVGRSIDVTRFKDYHELVSAIACMFGLEGQLDDPRGSEWKLVYVDYENDVLLVGDDPWEEFVNCVRCIKILSPSEVQQMSEEGVHLMNSQSHCTMPMS